MNKIKAYILCLILGISFSCNTSQSLKKPCKKKVKQLANHFHNIKNDKPVYAFKFRSKEIKSQHKEYIDLYNEINDKFYDCIIGIDKGSLINYFGLPSNGISKQQKYLMYYIRLNPDCGIKDSSVGDLVGDLWGHCNILEFALDENEKVKYISLDPTELGW